MLFGMVPARIGTPDRTDSGGGGLQVLCVLLKSYAHTYCSVSFTNLPPAHTNDHIMNRCQYFRIKTSFKILNNKI
ncbi:hypothetical protein LV92_03183 [Arenibacter echinorum]|uniref:Uncharacterized protein n=1 Tax=Arenibacter echinorum TaxID=440515 RepID=A0A327QYA1_9FLAO|nr:hypothetical protein LV92_03183 [Arenibacter echinorum]